MKRCYFVLTFFLLSLTCCAHAEDIESKMDTLAAQLKHLSDSVESAVRYKHAPDTLSDKELLIFATKHDPGLIGPFEPYVVKARSVAVGQVRHSDVLVCSPDGRNALLEDIGCTARMDSQRWHEPSPCEFSLDVVQVCSYAALNH